MRSPSLGLPLLLAATLFAGACASPLDEPLGDSDDALRADVIGDLPACGDYDLSGDAGLLAYEDSPGVYVVVAGGSPLCVGDENDILGAGMRTGDVLQGTPLPAYTGGSGTQQDGTPLPAKK